MGLDGFTYAIVRWTRHHHHTPQQESNVFNHLRRFVYALSPQRTDVWDFRTYGSPWSSRANLSDWLHAVGMHWSQTR
jgi:hypothetical protein